MATRVSYPVEVKMKAIEMRLAGPKYTSELEKIKEENRFLKQQLDLLKKYKELERRCLPKL